MPPKAATDAEANIKMLISALVTVIQGSEAKIDSEALQSIVGLSHPKNVPRKLDSLLKPHGYMCKNGQITAINDMDGGPTAAASSTQATKVSVKASPKRANSPSAADDDEEDGSPKKKAKATVIKAKGTAASKVKAENNNE